MCTALLTIIEDAEPLKQGLQREHAGRKKPWLQLGINHYPLGDTLLSIVAPGLAAQSGPLSPQLPRCVPASMPGCPQ